VITVCYVVDAPFLGGAEWYVSRLAGALDRRRFRPCVLMRAGSADARLAAWVNELGAGGIDVDTIAMNLPFRPAGAAAVWRWLDRRAPDIVHVNMPGPYDGQMGLLVPIARAAGARTVVTEHLPMVERLWKRAAVKSLAFRGLDVAVTMTRANAHYLRERQGIPAARIRVVPNGIRASYGTLAVDRPAVRRDAGLPPTTPLVIHVGNILVHKGLFRLLEAMSEVAGDPWHVAVLGTGPDEARCRRLVAERGISGRVTFLGAGSSASVEQLVAAADLLVLPSEIEGLPYTVLEAMACARPVVAGNVYGLPEVVEDGVTGLLVDARSVPAIAGAVSSLLADPDLRARMGRAGRERFERLFTLERQVSRMEEIYRSLLARKGSAR
jgi:glycosyltransferase involved in cell wall biosynthesis